MYCIIINSHNTVFTCRENIITCPETLCGHQTPPTHLDWILNETKLTASQQEELNIITSFDNVLGVGTLTWQNPPMFYNGWSIRCRAHFEDGRFCVFRSYVMQLNDCNYATPESDQGIIASKLMP